MSGGNAAGPAATSAASATVGGTPRTASHGEAEPPPWQKWGPPPLTAAPEPPADKPIELSATGQVPVFAHVPTSQKVPPYEAYNHNTKIAVAECGSRAIVWWRDSMQVRNVQCQEPGKKLRPRDIIFAHFRGPAEFKGAT